MQNTIYQITLQWSVYASRWTRGTNGLYPLRRHADARKVKLTRGLGTMISRLERSIHSQGYLLASALGTD